MASCCRSHFLLRASCSNNGAENGVRKVASVRRQQEVIAVGRCFWLSGPFKCWVVQEKIRSGCFWDAWRGGSLTVLSLPWCSGSWYVSKPTLAWADPQGESSFCSLPSPGQLLEDAARAEQDGWKGQDCWSSLSLSPTGNSCPRETSAQCFEQKHFQKLPASNEKTWVWCFGFASRVWKISPTACQSDNWLQPFGHFLSAAFKRIKSWSSATSVWLWKRCFSRRTGTVSEETKLSLKDLCILTIWGEKPILQRHASLLTPCLPTCACPQKEMGRGCWVGQWMVLLADASSRRTQPGLQGPSALS